MDILEEGVHIYLREIRSADWESLHAYASREEACKFQPWGPNKEQDSILFVQQAIRDREVGKRSRFVFAIVNKQTDHIVGNIEMNILDWNGIGEIGFIIHPDYWGKGYATEAGFLMLHHSFEKCNMHRVEANCCPDNVASLYVMEKLGMVREGRLRQNMLVKGVWHDSFLYSLLREEWMNR